MESDKLRAKPMGVREENEPGSGQEILTRERADTPSGIGIEYGVKTQDPRFALSTDSESDDSAD